MKRSSKMKGVILAGAFCLALAACDNRTEETTEGANVQQADVQAQAETLGVAENREDEVVEQTTAVMKVEQEEESIPIELAADFDEEFVLKPGERLYVGREGISIGLDRIEYDEYGTLFVYTLNIDGEETTGLGFAGIEIDNQISQDVFTENRVCCIGAEEDKSVTLLITSGTVVPDPMVLSGNGADKYVTSKPEYVETDEMILFLEEGVTVYGNTMELLEKLIDIAEKESGLYMENDTPYSECSGNSTDWMYGQQTFQGVDPTGEKFHIYVVSHEVCEPCAYGNAVVLNPMDLEIAAGDGYVMLHETLHCLQMRNGVLMGDAMDEGFATYMTGRICDKDEEMNFNFDAKVCYSYYATEITKENAEEVFMAEKEDNWENYLYGFRFVTYLYETYGEDIYRTILKDASFKDSASTVSITPQATAKYVKKHTSDTVFEDFAEWLAENGSRFDG